MVDILANSNNMYHWYIFSTQVCAVEIKYKLIHNLLVFFY